MQIANRLRTVENIFRDDNVGTVDDKRTSDNLTRPENDSKVPVGTAREDINCKEIKSLNFTIQCLK